MTTGAARRLLLGMISVAGLAAVASINRDFYRRHPQELWFDYYLLPPVPVLRVISLGQDASLADLLYTSTTITPDYFKDRAERPRIVLAASDAAFQLSPDFREAIYFGHYFVEFEKYEIGPGRRDARLLASSETSYLLLEGFHASQTSGQFAEVAAQEQLPFKKFGNVEHLAKLALAKQPDALVASSLIALVRVKEGDDAGALKLWREIEAKTESRDDPEMKYFHAVALIRINYLMEKPRIDELDALVEEFRRMHGRLPVAWSELSGRICSGRRRWTVTATRSSSVPPAARSMSPPLPPRKRSSDAAGPGPAIIPIPTTVGG
jgi:hypothetical protein